MAASAESIAAWRRHPIIEWIRLARLNRPIGIWLLLWPTLWALWVAAGGTPAPRLVAIFVAGTVLMRSAGCIVNDFADRNIDPHVRRTRDRPLAARRVSPYTALILFAAMALLALLLALMLNAAAIRLALIGGALTLSYPLFKRFFALPQLYLGLAFGWGVPMAFAATLGYVPRAGWVMLLAAVLWAGVYDTFYALVDRDDDRRIGVHSSAITFGDFDLVLIGVMQSMVLLALVLIGRANGYGVRYFLALAGGAGLFAWQQRLARRRDRAGCMRAFENNNWFGIVIFIGLLAELAGHG